MKWYSVVRRSSVLRHVTYVLQPCSQAAMSSRSPRALETLTLTWQVCPPHLPMIMKRVRCGAPGAKHMPSRNRSHGRTGHVAMHQCPIPAPDSPQCPHHCHGKKQQKLSGSEWAIQPTNRHGRISQSQCRAEAGTQGSTHCVAPAHKPKTRESGRWSSQRWGRGRRRHVGASGPWKHPDSCPG